MHVIRLALVALVIAPFACTTRSPTRAGVEAPAAPAAASGAAASTLDAHIEGAIIGALVGDVLGKGVEGAGLHEKRRALIPRDYLDANIMRLAMRDGTERFPTALPQPPGTYTDDSEEMLSVLLSLTASNGRVDQIEMVRQLRTMFVREHWYSDGTMALIEALRDIPDPANWRTVTLAPERKRMTYESNGCAMRISPVGLVALHMTDAQLRDMVTKACEITHPAPISTEGAITVAKATQLALRAATEGTARAAFDRGAFVEHILAVIRMSPHTADPAVAQLITRLERVKTFLAEIEQMHATSPQEADVREMERLRDGTFLGVGFKINDSVPAAIYLAARYIDNYERGLNRNVMITLPGDTDTVPAMSGAIIGAYLGVEAIPQRWIAQVFDTRDDGAPSEAWLAQWSAIWRDQLQLRADQVPARFDLRFLPLRTIRAESRKLAAIIRASH